MKSSFVRKGKAASSAPPLPSGTRLSAQNGALQISSGLADFDGSSFPLFLILSSRSLPLIRALSSLISDFHHYSLAQRSCLEA